MDEYIEREEIRRAYEKLTRSYVNGDPYIADWRFDEMIESLPAADVSSVRHGRWLFVTAGQMTSAWCCSECGRTVVITCDEELRQSKLEKEYPFCHCGAKMDLEE